MSVGQGACDAVHVPPAYTRGISSMHKPIQIVATCDEAYLAPLRRVAVSCVINNPGETFCLHLLHSSIDDRELLRMGAYCRYLGVSFCDHVIDRSAFDDIYASKRYPQEMYYRLLAPHVLDDVQGRVLYLDPDVLVINPLRPLLELDLEGKAFAAASHLDAAHPVTGINRIRLDTEGAYFNTGVILMDMPAARRAIDPTSMMAYARDHEMEMLFPDQDLFNAMYGAFTFEVPDKLWNYDARKYTDYLVRTGGSSTMPWVMENTSILHFCGRDKPWNAGYHGRFDALYKNYKMIAARAAERAWAEGGERGR